MKTYNNVIPSEYCFWLITLYQQLSKLPCPTDYNSRALVSYWAVKKHYEQDADTFKSIVVRCQETIDIPELFVESFFLASMIPGDDMVAHADSEKEEHGRWVPNHTPQRDHTGILYLNDGVVGGELVVNGQIIPPREGLLVSFPANHEYAHEVKKVISGNRYSLPIWFTKNPARAMRL